MAELSLEEIESELSRRGAIDLSSSRSEPTLEEIENALLSRGILPLSAPEASDSVLKQLGSGMIEGTATVPGLIMDVAQMGSKLFTGPITGEPLISFPYTEKTLKLLKPITAEPSKGPERYARTIGQFVGPSAGMRALGTGLKLFGKVPPVVKGLFAASKPSQILSDVAAGAGAQFASDVAPESKIAPLIGAAVPSSLIGTTKNIAGGLAKKFKGPTVEEVRTEAANILKTTTKIPELQKELAAKIASLSDDELSSYITTAELTGDVGTAQLQHVLSRKPQLGDTGKSVNIMGERQLAREQVRQEMLEGLSETPGITKEALGTKLIGRGKDIEREMSEEIAKASKAFPRNEPIDISGLQKTLKDELALRQAGFPLQSPTKTLVDQLLEPKFGKERTSGQLQDIRSDALNAIRSETLQPFDERIMVNIESLIDSTMQTQLKDDAYNAWKKLRELTKQQKEIFARGTPGGALLERTARPAHILANVFKGDTKSVNELKAAIRNDPNLIEDVKRGVLDSIPRDVDGNLTASGTARFLNQNEGGLKELFGDAHYKKMRRISQDLSSEGAIVRRAMRASKGQSITEQAQTVAGVISKTLEFPLLYRVSPTLAIANRGIRQLQELFGINTAQKIEELLMQAMLDPSIALELARTPTTRGINTAIERLIDVAEKITRAEVSSVIPSVQTPPTLENKKKMKNESISDKKAIPTLDTNIRDVAYEFGLNPRIVRAIVETESAGNPSAESNAGAIGLMQLKPSTANEVAKELGIESVDLKDPVINLRIGASYYKKLLDEFNDHELALTAYHSGPTRVRELLKQNNAVSLTGISKDLGPYGREYAKKVLGRV